MDLKEDNQELERVIDQLKSGEYGQADAAMTLGNHQSAGLHQALNEAEERARHLEVENKRLNGQLEQNSALSSAFQSNNRAYYEKLDLLQKEVTDKDEVIHNLKSSLQEEQDSGLRMREENNLIKGRCANLQRDIELHTNAVNKLSTDSGAMGEQLSLYKNRISLLEEELSKVKEEKTDQLFDLKRLGTEKDRLSEELRKIQTENVKSQGSSQASSATILRLQAQVQSAKSDLDVALSQKSEMEKVVKVLKQEALDAEKKGQDYFNQLLGTKENFQIL